MNPWLRGFFPTLTGGGECCYNRNSAVLVYFVEFGKRGKNSDFFFLIIKLNYPLKNEAPLLPISLCQWSLKLLDSVLVNI